MTRPGWRLLLQTLDFVIVLTVVRLLNLPHLQPPLLLG